ncbi:hypothetical protein FISHEDRAFT_49906 [Fistulina hepatica ATCC 64428]|uniref:JmjC domain-containing protein n=1 Tax=Fistulina hepatica ATCC 64428 TaxID=1128425 RepID=A0A0D7A260_9AGAR|nr:hypothetical protein FISHEDRAFT_49906 [Fistulina hepatica ATCC 64428]
MLTNQDGTATVETELQEARCMSNKYKQDEIPRCVSCTRRYQGDTCRFLGVRYFFKSASGKFSGMGFRSTPVTPLNVRFPQRWNVPLTTAHIHVTQKAIAESLLSTLRDEKTHLQHHDIIYRAREQECRATCDNCMTSIFSGSWMCRVCGREACGDCFQQIMRLSFEQPDIALLGKEKARHVLYNPTFLSCSKRHDHYATSFSPVTRFHSQELETAIAEMELEIAITEIEASVEETSGGSDSNSAPWFESKLVLPRDAQFPLPPEGTRLPTSAVPSYVVPRVAMSELDEETFASLWKSGLPLLVEDVKLQLEWTPNFFLREYGDQTCLIGDCQVDVMRRSTVGEFFSKFGEYASRPSDMCWRLKDWPVSEDFEKVYPRLFQDFSESSPAPTYIRRDGALNIASHFPLGALGPDLGPKMYNAFASHTGKGSMGSTRLHMDIADAMNIMTYAAPTPDGAPGSAAWDIFRADDSPVIRDYLKEKFGPQAGATDPIHGQQYYLDEEMRDELFKKYNVVSYRFYQRPGEAVFIPAGCAHQVCNLADCMKVAIDFVSPEHVGRCQKLTQEFREQNYRRLWKEDVLQVKNMLWYAWQSCSRQLKERLPANSI